MIEITDASIDAVLDTLDAEPDSGSLAACIGITEPDDGSSSPPAIIAHAFNLEPEDEAITAALITLQLRPQVAMYTGAAP